MFEISKRLALGAALTAPVVGLALPVDAAHAANLPPPLKNQCVTPELTPAQMAAGTKSVLSCFATLSLVK